jgi:hypothetical protein
MLARARVCLKKAAALCHDAIPDRNAREPGSRQLSARQAHEMAGADGRRRQGAQQTEANIFVSFPSERETACCVHRHGDCQLPCSEVVVARGGKVVYRQSAGEAKPGMAVSEDSLYRIYSCVLLFAFSTFCRWRSVQLTAAEPSTA